MNTVMSNTSILAALSLLATGSLALLGCDKDAPATEVPAAATTQDVAAHEAEPEEPGSLSAVPENVVAEPEPSPIAADDRRESDETEPSTVADATAPEKKTEDNVVAPSPPPKPRAKPRTKTKKKRSRARASKGEAACGEGTCA